LVPRNYLTGAGLVSVNFRVARTFGFGARRGANAAAPDGGPGGFGGGRGGDGGPRGGGGGGPRGGGGAGGGGGLPMGGGGRRRARKGRSLWRRLLRASLQPDTLSDVQ